MRSFLVAVLVVLAIAHESESLSLVKQDLSSEVERISKYLQDLTASVTSTAQDVTEKLRNHELTGKAQTFLEDQGVQLQPLADQVQEQAEKIREQLTPYMANIEAHVRPLADNVQAQVQPLLDNVQAQVQPLVENFQTKVEEIYKMMLDQTKALLPAQ